MRGYDAFQCYFELVNVRVSACSANRFNANGLTFGRACDREISGIAGQFDSLELELEQPPSTETAGLPCLRASFLSVFQKVIAEMPYLLRRGSLELSVSLHRWPFSAPIASMHVPVVIHLRQSTRVWKSAWRENDLPLLLSALTMNRFTREQLRPMMHDVAAEIQLDLNMVTRRSDEPARRIGGIARTQQLLRTTTPLRCGPVCAFSQTRCRFLGDGD